MKHLDMVLLAAALVMPISSGLAEEFPSAPPNLKEMEAKGLPRLTAEELKAFYPGVIELKGTRGKHLVIHNPDGTFMRKGFKDVGGKWRLDEKNSTICKAMQKKKGYEENCFAVFRAPDGVHHFDYDVQDGFYAHTWRKSSEE